MQYFISVIIGLSLGSIPTAFLILKLTHGIDIRKSGSGNVGAFNSIATSNSKLIGVFVLIIDFSKGLLTVYLINDFYAGSFILPALGICCAVFTHNYNPWLKFKGGRGLATAAGGSFSLFPFLLVVWLVLWTISFILKKNIIIANVFATVLSLLLLISVSEIAMKYTNPPVNSNLKLIAFTTILLSLIFAKHIAPFKEDFKKLITASKGIKDES